MNRSPEIPVVYEVRPPAAPALPLILDSPHSGRHYPVDFDHACPREFLERAEDNHVDELFACAPDHGATLLRALFPRTYIDVNRAVTDIDPALLRDRWPGAIRPTSRSHAGIGLIRRLVRPGVPVYDRKLTVREVQRRIEQYYHPYHDALARLLEDTHYRFGQVWHINCHSMPSFTKSMTPMTGPQPDFVLGDRDGSTCDPAFVHALRDHLAGRGFRVALNNPYKGVEILRRHARPAHGRHSVQIEINKGLYWDEDQNIKSIDYNALKDEAQKIIQFCARYIDDSLSFEMAAD